MESNEKKGRPILFSIMLGIVLTLLVVVASTVASIMELNDTGIMIAQGVAFFIMAVIVTVYMMKRDRSLEQFGFKKLDGRRERKALYYIPLLIIAWIQPLFGGFNLEISLTEVCIIVIFSLFVGYTEESVFRGIIKERLQIKGPVFYIVFSSIFFGILHMANAFNGEDILQTVSQVINAFLIGIILALLIELTQNIIPLIAFHFLYDALALMTNPDNVDKELLVVSILNILYLIYGVYLVYALMRKRKVTNTW
ncbi:hypothetical protein SAMN04488542_11010 [Fontibacillus panacisegetis]|uniref:CAAX prenyl protease 2/Lysostaphin resistance protein A-like domain-containing protein n=1 Tax=Fontibacillus panacisegetis TaxID=670482 RepID=A0A1G7KNA3_9BACL|nr:type II CAAX endopeptidase family protein [Fontibacillus panacisegetis]SDF38616.1 hypothetical protein SAMN04488542_11010 [Fontibacillus panacisegetis]